MAIKYEDETIISIDNITVQRYDYCEVIIMNINTLLEQRGLTKYKLAKLSGVPQMTVSDICSGKTRIEKCSGATLYKLAKTLDVQIEMLLAGTMEYRTSFETFKSNICHLVRNKGDLDFIIDTLESDEVRTLFNREWYPESLYLLAMTDYLCRENDLPLCAEYSDLRSKKMSETIYPLSITAICAVSGNDEAKVRSCAEAIPEFKRHNIVESEIRNVV